MPLYLRQSTASQEVPLGYFVDSTDGNTEETALTINNTDIKVWKTGATTLASKNSGGGTHISNGIYYAVLDATDTDTIGSLVLFAHVTGSLPVRVECVVLDEAVYDELFGTSASATAAAIADAVWDEARAGHVAAGSFGEGVLVQDLTTTAKASVNAEVVDTLATDTYAEPGQGTPAATTSLAAKINYLYKNWRNRKTQTSTTWSLYNDDATTVDQKSTVADDGTTGSKTEVTTGP
jgi:hypothetical protein